MRPVGWDPSRRINRRTSSPAKAAEHSRSSEGHLQRTLHQKPEINVDAGCKTTTMRRELVWSGWPPLSAEASLFFPGAMTRNDEHIEAGRRLVVLSGEEDLRHRLRFDQPSLDEVTQDRLGQWLRTAQQFPLRHGYQLGIESPREEMPPIAANARWISRIGVTVPAPNPVVVPRKAMSGTC